MKNYLIIAIPLQVILLLYWLASVYIPVHKKSVHMCVMNLFGSIPTIKYYHT